MMTEILVGILTAAVASIIAFLFQMRFNAYREKNDKKYAVDQVQRDGLQAVLMSQLYDKHEYYCKQKGFATSMEKNIYEKMYKSYHILGVNGLMTSYYNEVMSLPESFDTNK